MITVGDLQAVFGRAPARARGMGAPIYLGDGSAVDPATGASYSVDQNSGAPLVAGQPVPDGVSYSQVGSGAPSAGTASSIFQDVNTGLQLAGAGVRLAAPFLGGARPPAPAPSAPWTTGEMVAAGAAVAAVGTGVAWAAGIFSKKRRRRG